MSRYYVTVPFVDDMGTISPFIASSTPLENHREDALWQINSMRDHDGLPHLKKLPVGTKFDRIVGTQFDTIK